MNTISKSKFADKCGVSKQAITKAVKSGAVITDGNGKVDLDHRVTRDYVKEQKRKAKLKPKPLKKKHGEVAVNVPQSENQTNKKGEQLNLPSISDINSIRREDLIGYQKPDLDKLKVYEEARLKNIQVQEKEGTLISRALVEKVFSKIYTVDTEQLRAMEERLAPKILDICKVGHEDSEAVKVREEVNNQISKILENIKRIIDKFLVDIDSEKLKE